MSVTAGAATPTSGVGGSGLPPASPVRSGGSPGSRQGSPDSPVVMFAKQGGGDTQRRPEDSSGGESSPDRESSPVPSRKVASGSKRRQARPSNGSSRGPNSPGADVSGDWMYGDSAFGKPEGDDGMGPRRDSEVLDARGMLDMASPSKEVMREQWRQMALARMPKEERLKEVDDLEAKAERQALADSMGLTVEELDHMEQHTGDDDNDEYYRETFKKFDADGSGDISPEELRTALQEMKLGLDDDDIEQMIREADADGDGSIDYDEFVRLMKAKKQLLDMARALTGTRVTTPAASERGMSRRGSRAGSRPASRGVTTAGSGSFGASLSLDLPPLDMSKTRDTGGGTARRKGKGKGKGGANDFGSRPTPKVLQVGIRATTHDLRRELAASKAVVSLLDKKVQEDVAWVQANCPITNIRAQMFCQKWGFQKMADIMKRIHHSFLIGSWLKWRDFVEFTRNKERAEAYLKYKGSRTIVNMFKNWKRKKLMVAWNSWMVEVYAQREAEAEAASVDIQRVGRGFMARRRVQHIVDFAAAVEIQRIVRGVLARARVDALREWMERDEAARYIQNKYRGYSGRKLANAMLKAQRETRCAREIQRIMRGVLGRMEADRRREDQLRKEAAVEIQRVQRGIFGRAVAAQRRLEKRKHYGAARYQAAWRGLQGRRAAALRRKVYYATLTLQRTTRGMWGRQRAAERRRWVKSIVLQCAWRCYVARCEVTFRRQTKAAVQIQGCWRGRQGRKFFHRMMAAKREDDRRKKEASTNIQRVFRGFVDRRNLARRLQREKEEDASINIQRVTRGFMGRRRHARLAEEKRIFELHTAKSLMIQTVYRGYCGRKVAKLRRAEKDAEAAARAAALKRLADEEEMRKARLDEEASMEEERQNKERQTAAVSIQRIARGKLARNRVQAMRELRAVLLIQSVIRMFVQRCRYLFKKRKHEEAAARALAKKIEEDRQNGATMIQCMVRQRIARRVLREKKEEYERARKRIEHEMADKARATEKAKQMGMTLVEYKRFLRSEEERLRLEQAAIKIQFMGQRFAARMETDRLRKVLDRGKKSAHYGKPRKPGAKVDLGIGSSHHKAAVQRSRERAERLEAARVRKREADKREAEMAILNMKGMTLYDEKALKAKAEEKHKITLNNWAQEEAAIRIEATVRRRLASMEVEQKKLEMAAELERMRKEKARQEEIERKRREQEELLAAIKMQCMFRQRAARRVAEGKREELRKRQEAEAEAQRALEMDLAAAKIQALYRGRRDRALVAERRKELADEAAQAEKARLAAEEAERIAKEEAERAALEAGLPEGWEEYWDDNMQAYYYFNTETQEARWTKPGEDEGYGTAGTAEDYETDNAEDTPICIDCEYNYATRRCDQCEDVFCDACYDAAHETGRKAKHTWTGITQKIAGVEIPYCIECEAVHATKKCDQCGDPYCDACFETTHAKGRKRDHTFSSVVQLCVECETRPATRACAQCMDPYCDECYDYTHRKGKKAQHTWTRVSAAQEEAQEWLEYWDDTYQRAYYYNPYTQETVWTDPRKDKEKKK